MDSLEPILREILRQPIYRCKVCDVPFGKIFRNGRPPLHCEQHGHIRPYLERERQQRKAVQWECRVCLKTFIGHKKRYCSIDCRTLAISVQLQCVICNEPFVTRDRSSCTCSPRCRRQYQKSIAATDLYRCTTCEQNFTAPKQRHRKFCSQSCFNAYYKKRRNLIYNAARRLTEAGSPIATTVVNPIEVFKRDGWMCWLCNQPIDRSQQWPEPLSPTIDHVIPITRGGEHTMANVRCAHAICNNKKKNNIITCAAA